MNLYPRGRLLDQESFLINKGAINHYFLTAPRQEPPTGLVHHGLVVLRGTHSVAVHRTAALTSTCQAPLSVGGRVGRRECWVHLCMMSLSGQVFLHSGCRSASLSFNTYIRRTSTFPPVLSAGLISLAMKI